MPIIVFGFNLVTNQIFFQNLRYLCMDVLISIYYLCKGDFKSMPIHCIVYLLKPRFLGSGPPEIKMILCLLLVRLFPTILARYKKKTWSTRNSLNIIYYI